MTCVFFDQSILRIRDETRYVIGIHCNVLHTDVKVVTFGHSVAIYFDWRTGIDRIVLCKGIPKTLAGAFELLTTVYLESYLHPFL